MARDPVVVERLRVLDFRNLSELDLAPAPRLNVIAGNNGQGKTSLIEALYVVATSRSFRTNRLAEVIRHGQMAASVALQVNVDGYTSQQKARISARGRSWLIDGKKPQKLLAYATRTPVVVFHPGDLSLVSGSAQGRRTLLDRVALFSNPASADARLRYARALKSRQRVIEERGAHAQELDALEAVVAQEGAKLCQARARSAEPLNAALVEAFSELSSQKLSLTCRYLSQGSDDVAEFRSELRQRRHRDRLRRSASFGPHRDDLELGINGQAARNFASQGQQRLLALSIKMAELSAVAASSGLEPILLLDDVSSELDPTRTGAVYEFLRSSRSQVFVTTTRPELFVTPELGGQDRADFVLEDGRFLSGLSSR